MAVWDEELQRWRAQVSDFVTPAQPRSGWTTAWNLRYQVQAGTNNDLVHLENFQVTANEQKLANVVNVCGVQYFVANLTRTRTVSPDATDNAGKIAAKQDLADDYLLPYTVQNATTETVENRGFGAVWIEDEQAWWSKGKAWQYVHPIMWPSGSRMSNNDAVPYFAPYRMSNEFTRVADGYTLPMWAKWRYRRLGDPGGWRFPQLEADEATTGVALDVRYVPSSAGATVLYRHITTLDGVGYTNASGALTNLGLDTVLSNSSIIIPYGTAKGINGMSTATLTDTDSTSRYRLRWRDMTKSFRLRAYAATADAHADGSTGDDWLALDGVTLLYDVEIHAASEIGPPLPIDKRLDEKITVDAKVKSGVRLSGVVTGGVGMGGADGGGF